LVTSDVTGAALRGMATTSGLEVERVADMFKLLGDPTRCRILYAMLAAPDLPVLDIVAVVGASQPTVSGALRLLRTAGVVIGRRDGRTVHYRVADEHVAELLTVSWQHATHVGPAEAVRGSAVTGQIDLAFDAGTRLTGAADHR
jgi:DNA-binding transcriptional ArsR family regulator